MNKNFSGKLFEVYLKFRVVAFSLLPLEANAPNLERKVFDNTVLKIENINYNIQPQDFFKDSFYLEEYLNQRNYFFGE